MSEATSGWASSQRQGSPACRFAHAGYALRRGVSMTAFNAVRFRVKAGRDQDFLDAHKKVQADWPGLKHVNMIKTGERSYCIIAEWTDMEALANDPPSQTHHHQCLPAPLARR